MSNTYQRLPQSDDSDAPRPTLAPAVGVNGDDTATDRADVDNDRSYRPLRESIRSEFDRPPPATWKRVLLVVAILLMGYAAVKLGGWERQKPQVIYASREEHKYRPAASPVITEHLKDGRIRLRGASPGGVGVREEDLPLSKERKAIQEKKRVDEAKAAAAKKVKEKKQAIKDRRSKSKAKKRAAGKGQARSEI